MRKFINILTWDFKFAVRYHIVTVAAIVTLLYASIFFLFNEYDLTMVLKIMLFSDPTMLGFMFIGAMILFEKNSHVLQAIAVSPLKLWQYIWSKTIVLTTIALLSSLGMTLAARQFSFNPLFLIAGIVLSSFIFVFIGIIGVSKVDTFNEYILIIPLYFIPAILPLLNFLGITDSWVFYIFPTQATLDLLDATFDKISGGRVMYAISYLILCTILSFMLARKTFNNHVIKL